MEKLKKVYYYLFYQFYKWYEKGPSVWWSDWKAALSIDVLSIFLGISFITYYTVYVDKYFRLGDGKFFLLGYVLLVAVPNYFIFHHRDQWKDIVKEFDQLPKRTNKIGGWIVFGVVMLVITNMVFAFYQMSLVDWSQYR
ncbi:hypothetical protein H9Y05_09160 [Crocinitomicaceae bacterium CZZ-1]|uniref:Uncharacterized protein n=1 Tax=Taishania pollutisoli TaxID=2766479 RepID=A0A8J6TZV3_9FLAO|nr:hypothetical protein [Taishania pollutisoli]MBC9812638.1 hypothetical protein [Taishania pollutisoli]